jgi:hypothetical protein
VSNGYSQNRENRPGIFPDFPFCGMPELNQRATHAAATPTALSPAAQAERRPYVAEADVGHAQPLKLRGSQASCFAKVGDL